MVCMILFEVSAGLERDNLADAVDTDAPREQEECFCDGNHDEEVNRKVYQAP